MDNFFFPRVIIRYPEFESHYKITEVLGFKKAYSFIDIDGIDWFLQFYNRLLKARDAKEFLPLYRMGDGEYTFLLGDNIYAFKSFFDLNLKQIFLKLKLLFSKSEGHSSGTAIDGKETYTNEELIELKQIFIEDLRFISNKGILCLGLDEGKFYNTYMPEIKEAFDKYCINLNSENYYHVYHVYALFASSFGIELLKSQHVLIVTSLSQDKKDKFQKYIIDVMGAKKVSFYSISADKSMLDLIEFDKLEENIDIALIGAGVGSASILRQLEPLSIPCLDVGTVLGNMLDAERRFARPYMATDDIFDLDKVSFLNAQQKKTVRNSEIFKKIL
jgi:hypothetical protein